MKFRGNLIGVALALFALAETACATTNHWRRFSRADGLVENTCVSLTVGASGNVLVRHAKAAVVSVFDGYEFTLVPAPGTNRGRIYESPGGQLWTVAADGVLEFRDDEWALHAVPQLAAHWRGGATNEIRLQPVRQGKVMIFLPGQTLRLDASNPEQPRLESVAEADRSVAAAARVPLPEEFSVRHVYDIQTAPDGAVWFATSDGLFRQTRELWEAAPPPSSSEAPPDRNQPVSAELEPPPGEWRVHFTASNGDEWFGGGPGVARRQRGAFQYFLAANQLGPEDVFAFAQSPDGTLWCGTPHKVWEFDGRNWLTLRGGFDRIRAMHGARDGSLWVATANGLHRFTRGAWIANGPEDGLPSAEARRIQETGSGQILVETAGGWSAHRPEADADAPRTYIGARRSGETHFPEGAVVTLAFRGRDKWKHTSPHRLWFSYRLDERDWSPFQETPEITFTDLPLGKHYFQVRAMDRAGNVDPNPARLEFTLAVPWYRETRLVLILTGALAVAVFFAALAVNRHRRLRLSYAEVERQVAERTRELEIAGRELLHSQKMNALGTLAAGIAHDFNNILSIVKGSAQIIEDNLDNPQKVRVRVDRIKTVVEQGAGIVRAMLGFSRNSEGAAPLRDVNTLLHDTLTLLGDRFLRDVEVQFEGAPDLPEVTTTKDLVQQILLNFIFNAAESMKERKRVVLRTRQLEALPDALVLKPADAAGYIAIAVQDFGCGIPPENLSRVFEPFFTTKALSTRRGTGLGLSMAYELAKRLGAGLAVESAVGRGSTFTLILPVAQPGPVLHVEPEPATVAKP